MLSENGSIKACNAVDYGKLGRDVIEVEDNEAFVVNEELELDAVVFSES